MRKSYQRNECMIKVGAICWGVIVVQSAVEQRSPGTEALQLQCARIVELQSANSGYLLKDEASSIHYRCRKNGARQSTGGLGCEESGIR